MVKKIPILAFIGIFLLAACGNQAAEQPQQQRSAVSSAASMTRLDGDFSTVSQGTQDQTAAIEPVQARIVLKNASLTLVVDDAATSLNQIAQLAESSGGWVVTSNTSKISTGSGEEVTQGTITIRIPAEKLTATLDQIKSGALSIDAENVTGQDVTQDYIDLTSQLGNLKAAETQLQTIMDGARNTDDVLSIYNELVRVRGEIDTTQGRIRYYDESSAYSSISVTLIPQAIETPIQIAGWSPGRTAENALAALINVLHLAADLLITLAILVLPLLLIFGLPGWLIYRTLARRGIIAVRTAPNLTPTVVNDTPTEE